MKAKYLTVIGAHEVRGSELTELKEKSQCCTSRTWELLLSERQIDGVRYWERGLQRRLGDESRADSSIRACKSDYTVSVLSSSPSTAIFIFSLHPSPARLRTQSAWHRHTAFLIFVPRHSRAHPQARTLHAVLPPQKKQRGAEISMYECSLLSPLLTQTHYKQARSISLGFLFFPRL